MNWTGMRMSPAQLANHSPLDLDDKMCDIVVEFHPEVVSFHFGLPEEKLLRRVRDAGAKVIFSATSSATSVDDALARRSGM
jgi:nitronate monooxygenase